MTCQLKWFLSITVVAVTAIVMGGIVIFQPSLDAIHHVIKKDYQSVTHINASDFSQLNSGDVVVFDVREPEEFEVSHIKGAIQIMPNIDVDDFIDDYGGLLQGKQVVFYCSVGRRSSDLANKLGDTPLKQGALSSKNLIGGVFSWANEERELSTSSQDSTNLIHPYNQYWGRLIEDQRKVSYHPE